MKREERLLLDRGETVISQSLLLFKPKLVDMEKQTTENDTGKYTKPARECRE
jgi:hypothetical protein